MLFLSESRSFFEVCCHLKVVTSRNVHVFFKGEDMVSLTRLSRWWFQIFFIFTPIWGNDPF